jgi:Icc-related predicted phosphoesterase
MVMRMKWTNKIETMFRNKHETKQNDNKNVLQNKHIEPIKIPFNLTALVIADTHGCLRESDIPKDVDYDVCLLLGDVYDNDLKVLLPCIHSNVYGILGNHDGFGTLSRFDVGNLHGGMVEINGVKIAGLQGSIKYKNADMPLYTDEESDDVADILPLADILISHDSPKYVFGTNDFAHSGLTGITKYCEKHNIPLNLHGHHHENKTTFLENGTTSICTYGVNLITINNGLVDVHNYANF